MGLSTFSTALSGLATNSQGLNVVGNNLANLNTIGFKSSTISFADVLGQMFSTAGTAASGNIMTIGLGAQVSSVRRSMTQGSLQTTSNPLDVAIQGKGLLTVRNNNGHFGNPPPARSSSPQSQMVPSTSASSTISTPSFCGS